ncbi:MAG: hypothetical protein ACI9Y7_000660 [Dokdonia sp.]|jgi:hypothetical protein
MKTKNTLLLTLATIILYSCSSDDSNVIADSFDNGAFIEAITITDNTIFSDSLEGGLETNLEYRDSGNGGLLDTFNVYITFLDNTDNAGDSTDAIVREEIFLRAIEATTFSIGPDGFPRYNLIVPTQDFLTSTNNSLEGIATGDEYIIRFELVLTDGRIFSINNTGISGGLIGDFSIITPVE